MKIEILTKSNFVEIPKGSGKLSVPYWGTISVNMARYGFALSKEAVEELVKLSDKEAVAWWKNLEPVLQNLSGSSRKMENVVVYKNFPTEVLEKTEAEYWLAQILMYVGFPHTLFGEPEKDRPSLFEKVTLKVLRLANKDTLQNILNSLLQSPARWTKEQQKQVDFLLSSGSLNLDPTSVPFKENFIQVVQSCIDKGINVQVRSATDVLRLGVGLSCGDVSFKEKSRFINFNRRTRRYLVNLLEKSSNLEEDVARDKEKWKKFLRNLHPSDFGATNVCRIQKKLYKNNVRSFNSTVEMSILFDKEFAPSQPKALTLLSKRPGDYMRRFQHLYELYGNKAVRGFAKVLNKLSAIQLLKIDRYLATVNSRVYRTIAPKGDWSKLQILANNKSVDAKSVKFLREKISEALKKKLYAKKIKSCNLQDSAKNIKIQGNDADLSPYGRGTVFQIPGNMKFLRLASYWKAPGYGTVWFDNGVNFFDANWYPKETINWLNPHRAGAAFSGDPVCGSPEMKGRACQMIDLYLDKLESAGVRYAVWNILCYSRITFDKVEDVFASLQWGEEATDGKLFEPSRCQLAFPIKSKSYTKYVVCIDLKERTVTYLDANLKANVTSATYNEGLLSQQMPAYLEYLNTLPSVHDLFKPLRKSVTGPFVGFSDKGIKIKSKTALVFKPENKGNTYKPLDVQPLLK